MLWDFSPVGEKQFTIRRYPLPTFTKGKPVQAAPVDIVIQANIQPATSDDTFILPEAFRTSSAIMIFSKTELREAKEGSYAADEVTFKGDDYVVMRVWDYTNEQLPLLSHYEAIAVRRPVAKG